MARVPRSWKAGFPALLALALAGCAPSGNGVNSPRGTVAYQGTASVGDFLSITVDRDARTITYENHSNGLAGIATYTVAGDGALLIDDPTGNFATGYELPGHAMALEARRTGQDRATRSLVFAIVKEPIRKADAANSAYNYMQFRTRGGGIELGSSVIDGAGTLQVEGFGPLAHAFGMAGFFSDVNSLDMLQEDSTGSFLYIQEPGEQAMTYVFRSRGGFLLVDTPNGSHILIDQQPSRYVSPAWAGTYGAILYRKDDAWSDGGNVEHGDVSVDRATVTVRPDGVITIAGAAGDSIASGRLAPVAEDSTLTGPGRFQNACPGLFTFRRDSQRGREEFYVMFLDRAIFLASFIHDPETIMQTNRYAYFYGAGLRR